MKVYKSDNMDLVILEVFELWNLLMAIENISKE